MAILLGSKNCIDSLAYDIQDVQTIIVEIISKIGVLNYTSWKFPDKLACSLNVDELLRQYAFSKNPEDNQMSHIMLFELLIDRLFLVLCMFLDSIQKYLKKGSIPSSANSIKSIGLVVKKCWNELSKLLTQETVSKDALIETKQMFPDPFTRTQKKTTMQATQTVETTFAIACSSCKMFQLALSSLSSLIKDAHNNINKHNNVEISNIWISEKDIDSSIERHKDLLKSIQQTYQNSNNDKIKLSNAAKQHESNVQSKENLINKLKKQMNNSEEILNERIRTLENDRKKFETETANRLLTKEKEWSESVGKWKKEIDELKNEINSKEDCIQKLGNEKERIIKEIEKNEEKKLKLSEEFQINFNILNQHLAGATSDLKKANGEISKERLKHQLVHDELMNLQKKYDKLVHRLDEFNMKNEDLVFHLKKSEKEKIEIESQLHTLETQLSEKERLIQSLPKANMESNRSSRNFLMSPATESSSRKEIIKRKNDGNVLRQRNPEDRRNTSRCSNCGEIFDNFSELTIHESYCK